ncbi:hypothetical protein DYB32_005391 [Aphanomyces invadans]|uniref:Major facilitator superfamily (MFS) profile domain-containing protein n=1 Tax=Aphanomyces invadans TaxID=157072 RepID=A0A3R7CZS6_9STRA|nr:hypothetical protein DYB32_005391 [Aphanomyces invadans]
MNVSWRAFSVAASMPAFLTCGLIYLFVPESPRFLVAKGKYQEASDTLTLIYAINGRSRLPDFRFLDVMHPAAIDASDPLYLVDSWGRKPLFAWTLFLSALCGILFAADGGDSSTFIVLICCMFQCTTAMAWIGYDVLSAEVYPLHMRVSALCFLSSTGRFGATLAQVVNGFLMGPPPHIEALLLITTVVMAMGGVSVLFLDDNVDNQGGMKQKPTDHGESIRLLA